MNLIDYSHGEGGFASTRLDSTGSLGPYPELQVSKEGDEYERRGCIQAIANNYMQAFCDSGLCTFALSAGSNFPLLEFICAFTGWNLSIADILTTGRRVRTLCQAFNIREGISTKDFNLPDRIAEPSTTGPYAGRSIDFNALRVSYYREMGWDVDTG